MNTLYLNIFLYEIKKIFSFFAIKYIILFLFVANIFFCVVHVFAYSDEGIPQNYIDTIHNMYIENPEVYFKEKDRIDNEFINLEIEPSKIYGGGLYEDYVIFQKVDEIIHIDEVYHDELRNLINQANNIISVLKSNSNENIYILNYQEDIIEYYSYLDEHVKISNSPQYGWDCYFAYSSDFIFVLITMLIISSIVFYEDKSSGFYAILSTSKNGRHLSAIIKIIVLLIVTCGVVLTFSLSNYMIISFTIGFSDANNAVQSIEHLKYVSYSINILEYLALCLSLKVLATLTTVFIFSMLASLTSNVFYYVASGIYLFIQYSLYLLQSFFTTQWSHINIFSLANPYSFLARFRSISIFGSSVNMLPFVYIFLLFFIIILSVTTMIIFSSPIYFQRIKITSLRVTALKHGNIKYKVHSLSLVTYELLKSKSMYFLIVFFCVMKVGVCLNYYQPIDSSLERMKIEYLENIEGEYSLEKEQYIQFRYSSCHEILSAYNEMQEMYWKGEISKEDYKQYMDKYTSAQGEYLVLESLNVQTRYLKEVAPNGWYIYDTGILKFVLQGPDWILNILIMIYCGMIYVKENLKKTSQSPVSMITSTTPKGRYQLLITKYWVSIITTLSLYTVFQLVDIAFMYCFNKIPVLQSPLCSLQVIGNTFGNIKLNEYILTLFLLGFLGSAMISVIYVNISFIFRRVYCIVPIIVLLLVSPKLLIFFNEGMELFPDITNLVDSKKLLLLCAKSGLEAPHIYIIVFFLVYICIAVILTCISCRLIKKNRG